MDRDYKNPEDVANASPDRVRQSLARVLRIGFESRPFLYRLGFRYAGGRAAPLLFIGRLNRSWNEYINDNARANDLAVGTCELGRGPTGRTLIKLDVTRGRGKRDAYLTELNLVLREINAEVVFAGAADAALAGAAPEEAAAADDAVPAGEEAAADPATANDAPAEEALDLRVEARAIRAEFDAFKNDPTGDALDALNRRVAGWQAALAGAPDLAGSKEEKFVEQLRTLLAAKGARLVARG